MPVRKALSPLSYLTPGRWAAIRAAQREAAVRAAREAAQLEAAARAARLPWRVAYRKLWGAACVLDRYTGHLGGRVQRSLFLGLGGGR